MVPYHIDAPVNYFTPEDPIDALLTFPPHLPFPTDLLRGKLLMCPGLCVPMHKDFSAFETLVEAKKDHAQVADDRASVYKRLSRATMVMGALSPRTWVRKYQKHEDDKGLGENKRVKNLWILYTIDDVGESKISEDTPHVTHLRQSLSKFYAGKLRKWTPPTEKLEEKKRCFDSHSSRASSRRSFLSSADF